MPRQREEAVTGAVPWPEFRSLLDLLECVSDFFEEVIRDAPALLKVSRVGIIEFRPSLRPNLKTSHDCGTFREFRRSPLRQGATRMGRPGGPASAARVRFRILRESSH